MLEELKLPRMIKRLEQSCEGFPDLRTGKNSIYDLADVGMSAFSVFFTQSPSFLAHQRDMKLRKGRSNAESLFQLSDIPSDNQIRNLLDPVSPEHLRTCLSANISGFGANQCIEKPPFICQSVVSGDRWDRIFLFQEPSTAKIATIVN